MTNSHSEQIGFDALLADADSENRARKFERETAHLPDNYDEAIPYYRTLIAQNHAAMLSANAEESRRLHDEARKLAIRLNDGEPGILAHEDAPGYVLERETAAISGHVPRWGQTGDFMITVNDIRVRIELEGMFGIGSGFSFWPGFSAHAVEHDRPFLSSTGYRSFLGIHADPVPGLTPDEFASKVITSHIERELKGRPVAIETRHRDRDA